MMHGCRKLMLMLEDVDEDEDEDVSSRLLAVSNVPRYGDYYVLPDQRYLQNLRSRIVLSVARKIP